MDGEYRKLAESQGYQVYDHAGDAVGLTAEEKQEMDLRIDLSRAVKKRREKLGLSQKDLAKRLKVSPAQAAKIELGNWDVPLEQILRAYSALGGRIAIKELTPHAGTGANGSAKADKKKARKVGARTRP